MVKGMWEVYLNLVHIHLFMPQTLRLRGRQPFDIPISLRVKTKSRILKGIKSFYNEENNMSDMFYVFFFFFYFFARALGMHRTLWISASAKLLLEARKSCFSESICSLTSHKIQASTSSFYIKTKLQIEQHLFQEDSQALKNSVTCGKGKKKTKTATRGTKSKESYYRPQNMQFIPVPPRQHLLLPEQLGAYAYLAASSIPCGMLLPQFPLLSLGDT